MHGDQDGGGPDQDVTEHLSMIVTGNWFNQPMKLALCALPHGVDYDVPDQAGTACEDSQEAPLTARLTAGGGYFYGNHFSSTRAISIPRLPPAPTLTTTNFHLSATCLGAQAPPVPGNAYPCDDTKKIQDLITNAAPGTHAAVHLRAGVYEVMSTLTVPANVTIEIFGDGEGTNGTVLRWAGPTDGYMFDLRKPSRAAIHDLRIENLKYGSPSVCTSPRVCSNLQGRGIHVESADDVGGILYFDRFVADNVGTEVTRQLPSPPTPTDNVGFSFAGFDHLRVWSEASGTNEGDVSVRVQGAGSGATDLNNVTSVKLFGPQVTGTRKTQYDVSNYGNLYVNGFAAENNTHAIQLGSAAPNASQAGRLTIINGKESATTGNTLVTGVTDPVQIHVHNFLGDVNIFGIRTTAPVNVLKNARGDFPNVLVFGNTYSNPWQWTPAGATLSSASLWWNENGPATPLAYVQSVGSNTEGWPTVYSRPWSTSYLDCATYVADDHYDPVAGVYPGFPTANHVIQTPSSTQGFFKVEGPSSTVRFLNNAMADPTLVGVLQVPAPDACRDITPVGAITPALDHALIEVRNAAVGNAARPCATNVTDARFFHIRVGAMFTRNAFAVDSAP